MFVRLYSLYHWIRSTFAFFFCWFGWIVKVIIYSWICEGVGSNFQLRHQSWTVSTVAIRKSNSQIFTISRSGPTNMCAARFAFVSVKTDDVCIYSFRRHSRYIVGWTVILRHFTDEKKHASFNAHLASVEFWFCEYPNRFALVIPAL